MSHFYGTLQGTRGAATRCGHRNSGMETYCASYGGAVRCKAYIDEKTGKDMVRVELVPWRGTGTNKLLYHGEINGGLE